MPKNLHIKPYKLTKNQSFEDITGVLTLQTAGAFNVSIPEYLEELKQIDLKIKKNISEQNNSYAKLQRLYALKSKDGWLPQERISNDANNQEYKNNIKKLEEEIVKLRSDKTNLNQKYKDTNWAWQLVSNGIKEIPNHNATFAHGLDNFTTDPNGVKQYQTITFSKLIEGGGLAWVEAFSPTIPATGKLPRGFFVRAIGTPKIIRAEWTDFDFNPIKTKVKFGSEVLLHIYTNAMYGQENIIKLIDKDIFDPNDELAIGTEKTFVREALVYKIHANEDKKLGVDGQLLVLDQATKKSNSEQYLQKMVVEVLITPQWKAKAGTSLKIYPTVQSVEKETYYEDFPRSYLEVGEDGVLYETPKEVTNLPVLVGEVETNAATFHPCRYDSIILKKQKGGTTELFNSKNTLDIVKKNLQIEIVAGKKETYLLDFDLKTTECPRDHKDKEITITSIPDTYKLKADASSKAKHTTADKSYEWIKTENSSGTNGSFGFKSTQKEDIPTESGIVTVRKSQIEFDSFYNYDIPNNANLYTFAKAMKYFWLPNLSNDKILRINGKVNTCAFNQNIDIKIYPDIKWTLKFGFNVKNEDIENLNRKGGKFAPLKSYEEAAEKKDEEFYKNNKEYADALKKGSRVAIYGAKLKPKPKEEPEEKGTSFKRFLEILSRITISLEEEHYGGDEKNELTEDFVKDLYNKITPAMDLAKKAAGIIEGDFDKKDFTPSQNLSIDGLMKKLKRKTVEYEFLYPKISFAGSWFYEEIEAATYPTLAGRQGLGIDLILKAAPLVGMTIKWDILELLGRRHPIAYAVLKSIDTLLYLLGGDESAVICDFTVTGKIDASIDLQHNFLAGFKEIDAKGTTAIQAKIELKINIAKTAKILQYDSILKLGFGASTSSGLGITDQYGVDNKGFYNKKILEFEGIKLAFEATGVFELNKDKGGNKKESLVKVGGSIEGEITFLNKKFETEKIYLIS